MPVESIPQSDEQEFSSLLNKLGLDRSQFTLTLTNHPAATFGPRVSTIKICWKNVLQAEYGATSTSSPSSATRTSSTTCTTCAASDCYSKRLGSVVETEIRKMIFAECKLDKVGMKKTVCE